MKKLCMLYILGVIAGVFLAVFLRVMQQITGSLAYILLFSVDYLPILHDFYSNSLVQAAFHFGTLVAITIVLYYFFRLLYLEKRISAYVIFIFIGSGLLYFLTMLSSYTPPITDLYSWIYWSTGHVIFSIIIGTLIKRWL